MPKNLFQNVIFTLMMSFLMVYVMICYNISLNIGFWRNEDHVASRIFTGILYRR